MLEYFLRFLLFIGCAGLCTAVGYYLVILYTILIVASLWFLVIGLSSLIILIIALTIITYN